MRIKHMYVNLTHDYLAQNNFMHVHAPISPLFRTEWGEMA